MIFKNNKKIIFVSIMLCIISQAFAFENDDQKISSYFGGLMHPGIFHYNFINGFPLSSSQSMEAVRPWETGNYKKAIEYINGFIEKDRIENISAHEIINHLIAINSLINQDGFNKLDEILQDKILASQYRKWYEHNIFHIQDVGHLRTGFCVVGSQDDIAKKLITCADQDREIYSKFQQIINEHSVMTHATARWVNPEAHQYITPSMKKVLLEKFGMDIVCEPKDIPNRLNEMIKVVQDNIKNKKNIFDVCSATHEEFVDIHPFSKGNGRTARLFMYILLKQNGIKHLPIFISEAEYTQKYHEGVKSFSAYLKKRSEKTPAFEANVLKEIEQSMPQWQTSIKELKKYFNQMDYFADNICWICQKYADSKCSQCKKVFYCSKECQSKDWKNHKQTCKK